MYIDKDYSIVLHSETGGVILKGEELKKARVRKLYTQQQLGEALGYKGRSAELTIQHWEHERQTIPIKHWRKLSEILDIPLDKFIP